MSLLGEAWSPDALNALLDVALKKHRVNPAAVYATGYSMGGAGTWSLAMDRPERFAGAAPLCGRAVPQLAARICKMPIWVFHGVKDEVVPIAQSRDMVNVLKGMWNDQVKFTVYENAGHEIWYRIYSGSELYDWFMTIRKQPSEAKTRSGDGRK